MKTKQRSILIIRRCIPTVESYFKKKCLRNHNKKRGYVESKFSFLVKIPCSYMTILKMVDYALVALKILSILGIFCRIIYGRGKYPLIPMLSLNHVKFIICR